MLSNCTHIINISCGISHSLILNINGTIYACGFNNHGELGLGDIDDKNTPTLISDVNNIINVSCGNYHSLALTSYGDVYAFGRNDYGQLGLGDNYDKIVPILLNLDDIIQITSGSYHSLLLTIQGHVYAFGHNINGDLGLGDNLDRNIPTLINTLPLNICKISSKFFHSLVLTDDNKMYAFGANYLKQLGLQDNINRNRPVLVSDNEQNLHNIVQISCGDFHSLILRDNGQVYTFGIRNKNIPDFNDIVQISAGGVHSLLLVHGGFVYAFGHNKDGQLGLGDNEDRELPEIVISISV